MSVAELEHFYEANLPKIYRFCFYKVLNREIAEDLTSQSFLKFVQEASRRVIKKPKAFLYGIARHVIMDFLRVKYQGKEVPLDEEDETLIAEFEAPEVHILDYLERLLPKVPEKQAIVLQLRFLEKLSLQEIATKLDKDVNYVSTTQKRGFISIKKLLQCTDVPTNIVEDEL